MRMNVEFEYTFIQLNQKSKFYVEHPQIYSLKSLGILSCDSTHEKPLPLPPIPSSFLRTKFKVFYLSNTSPGGIFGYSSKKLNKLIKQLIH